VPEGSPALATRGKVDVHRRLEEDEAKTGCQRSPRNLELTCRCRLA
jgi:hypothetical protein